MASSEIHKSIIILKHYTINELKYILDKQFLCSFSCFIRSILGYDSLTLLFYTSFMLIVVVQIDKNSPCYFSILLTFQTQD
jgi:hypothetical protein